MSWLRKAVTAGYVNPDSYRIESALDPLRGREDFKKFVAELEMKAKATVEMTAVKPSCETEYRRRHWPRRCDENSTEAIPQHLIPPVTVQTRSRSRQLELTTNRKTFLF